MQRLPQSGPASCSAALVGPAPLARVDGKLAERRESCLQWLERHAVPGQGILVSTNQNLVPYPEVTGYLVPTLLAAGRQGLARQFLGWLPTVQKLDGSFTGPRGADSFAFDTGQVVRGLVAGLALEPSLEQPLRRACQWLLDSSSPQGRLPLSENPTAWSMGPRGQVSEGVHLYVLPALAQAGQALNEPRYLDFVRKSRDYYLGNLELTDFSQPNMLSHFYGYIQEALYDLGAPEMAARGMAALAELQQEGGAVPAYSDVSWVCSPGLAQAALVWLKLGEVERAQRALSFLALVQNPSGGFFGSYGAGADYFVAEEIAWPVKYFLDALHLLEAPAPAQAAPPPASTPPASTRAAGLDAEAWHEAIVAGSTTQEAAQRLRRGEVTPWVRTLAELTAPGQEVLELGSGTGEISAALALAGRNMCLLDFSDRSLDYARQLFAQLGLSARFSLADVLEPLPFQDGAFDCVLSSGLLEHFSDEEIVGILAEAARVCRGQVVSLVPNAASLAYRLGKWTQEENGTWPWGREDPKFTLAPHFQRAGLSQVREFSLAPEHALRFLNLPDWDAVRQQWQRWLGSLNPQELQHLNQGYLLATVGQARRRA